MFGTSGLINDRPPRLLVRFICAYAADRAMIVAGDLHQGDTALSIQMFLPRSAAHFKRLQMVDPDAVPRCFIHRAVKVCKCPDA